METNNDMAKRITYKRARPNPLFQEWLEELYEEAKEKKSKLEAMLKQALESLSKYPLPLASGAECIILKGFGKHLCAHLDRRLEVHNINLIRTNSSQTGSTTSSQSCDCNSPMSDVINIGYPVIATKTIPSEPKLSLSPTKSKDVIETVVNGNSSDSAIADRITESQSSSSQQKKDKTQGKRYKPALKSGAYALLIALLEHFKDSQLENSLTKEELIDRAQKHSEESFIRPKPGTYYTAWSNMTRLLTKGLVTKVRKKKVRYLLSEEGLELAEELLRDSRNIPTVNDIIFSSEPSTSAVQTVEVHVDNEAISIPSENVNNNNVIEMAPGTFDVILLIDKNETGGASKKNDPTVAQFNKYPDLNHEYRSLKVGDFTWIARHKVHTDQELVLPYIIERKRMDDLGASIKDGRFHEQKFRLRKCGLKNVVYMIENYGSNKHVGLPIQHLMQALANTRVQDGFKVHVTDSLTNSARFLAMMTKRLTIRYKDKHLKGCNADTMDEHLMTFEYFNKASAKSKPLTVTETFIKLLLQLKGVSVEKALAITAEFSTPKSLIIRYQKCDRNEGEYLLANLKYGSSGRNVGPTVSKSIYQLFTKMECSGF